MIAVGDEIKNCHGNISVVTEVQVGKYGIFIREQFEHIEGWAYFPYELPPCKSTDDWYNWRHRGTTTLPSGVKVGDVCGSHFDTPKLDSVVDCDERWEHTILAMEAAGTTFPIQSIILEELMDRRSDHK
ncbi:hypothetical protein LCGC14_0316020 [marine sediment metagenome]|uniref:Uncharacterized protein n=1 Tax=marine sediment metagenome TaxID=412755 RepID=A0A0F9TKB1_9ZZZZ